MNVYFDNAATTPLDNFVLEKMLPYMGNNFGNPSSIHQKGRKVKSAMYYPVFIMCFLGLVLFGVFGFLIPHIA